MAAKKAAHKAAMETVAKEGVSKKEAETADNQRIIKRLMVIPGVGKSIAHDLLQLGIHEVSDLVGRDPEELFDTSNRLVGQVQDRCLLYVFRCAVYFASTPERKRTPEKLLWWNWKDTKADGSKSRRAKR